MDQNTDNEIAEEDNNSIDDKEVGETINNSEQEMEDNSNSPSIETNDEEINSDNNTEKLQEELVDTKDKLLRALAENENIRKQMDKTRQEGIKYGVQPLAREILSIVDNFDRALNSKSESNEKALEEGFVLIKKEILSIFDKFNIMKINALGEVFDANYHQAMFEKETNEYKAGQVCEIVQEGYRFHERLLRPALVGIAKKIEDKKETESFTKVDREEKEEESKID